MSFYASSLHVKYKAKWILYFTASLIITMNVVSIAMFLVQCHPKQPLQPIRPPVECFSPDGNQAIIICIDGGKDQISIMLHPS